MHNKNNQRVTIHLFLCLLVSAGALLGAACQQKGGIMDSEEAVARLDTFKKHQEMRAASPFKC